MSLKFKLVAYFLLLSLLPLAAAAIGFRAAVTSSETRRIDVRLEADLRAALVAYTDELELARRRALRLADNRDLQRALQNHDRAALLDVVASTPTVRIVSPQLTVGTAHPQAARRNALVRAPDGKLLGLVVVALPVDEALISRLQADAGIAPGDRLVAVRNGQILGEPGTVSGLDPGEAHVISLGGTDYRALEANRHREAPAASFAILAPQREIDSAIARAERRLAIGLLGSVLLIALVAYVVGRSIVRSLSRLSDAAYDLAQGRTDVRVPVRGSDEFALLGRSFNRMAEQLESRLAELARERARLHDVTTRFGQVLAATHDSEQLRRAIVDTAVEASGAAGGRLVGARAELVEVGRTGVGDDRIELPLRAASTDFGTLVLNGERFTSEQRDVVASLVSPSVIALENARLHRIVERQALVDALTGLANRRQADDRLAGEFHRAERFYAPLAVVLADIDDFKAINDAYGHPVGDLVLDEFGHTLSDCVRDIDLAGRWGGEEFILVLPGTDAQGAGHVAERVRAALRRLTVAAPDGTKITVAASFGVAAYPDVGTAAELVAAADAALYSAKRAGKDQVVVASVPTRQR